MAKRQSTEPRFAITLLALLHRKPSMSRDEFIAYYENEHAAFVTEPLKEQLESGAVEYRRFYVVPQGLEVAGVGELWSEPANPAQRFDVVTQLSFVHMKDYTRFMNLMKRSKMLERRLEDDRKFLDSSVPELVFVVQTYE